MNPLAITRQVRVVFAKVNTFLQLKTFSLSIIELKSDSFLSFSSENSERDKGAYIKPCGKRLITLCFLELLKKTLLGLVYHL